MTIRVVGCSAIRVDTEFRTADAKQAVCRRDGGDANGYDGIVCENRRELKQQKLLPDWQVR
jgi:hypothetical protein